MTKLTLRFTTLEQMAQFASRLKGGYVLNTISLTLTATVPQSDHQRILHHYYVETKERVRGG